MHFAHILVDGAARFARVTDDTLVLLQGPPWSGATETSQRVARSTAVFLPVSPASKVVAIGQNYRKHAAEMGKTVPNEPLIFLKPSTALNAHQAPIVLPNDSAEVHFEAELALIIGTQLTRATPSEAAAGIFALTCFNDVTARDIQKREIQHTRAKSYDTFACCGPFAVTGVSPDDLRIVCRVNGQVRQDSRTSDMVHAPAHLVSFISHIMTLLPGDIVSTGTPSGVGALAEGDTVEVDIENVGVLRNSVRRSAP
jgi:2-keto-4-pentenoate hydratase/2-oxohepta-3-ene-1,7-dioic acid hydratase in catechol pathway